MKLLVVLVFAACGPKAVYDPHVEPASFQSTVDNPYLPLVPGTTWSLVERHGERTADNKVTVTSETRTIMGVTCIVVHDTVSVGGKVVEDTYDWFAQDRQGTVWYFGEATTEYGADGPSTEGSWEAGVEGARPGIAMPGSPTPGAPYRMEYKRTEAEDMGQIIAVDQTVTVPAGTFTGCLKVKEWSLLERGHEHKWYCKGVGVVRTESTDGEVAELAGVQHAAQDAHGSHVSSCCS